MHEIMRKRLLILLLAMTLCNALFAQLRKVYDEQIDPMEQIDQALAIARAQDKYVVCQVGGNWCPWCLRFADMVERDSVISQVIEQNYVYIHVNYPRQGAAEALMSRLHNPGRFGYPVFVILDADGQVVHIQDSSFLEEGKGYDQQKVLRFFNSWTPEACGHVRSDAAATSAPDRVPAPDRVVVGYVTSWSDRMPDASLLTHVNYAFGHVSDSFDGVRIDNDYRLRSVVALRQQNPALKVLLSVGGWGSGRFSEMAATEHTRLAFAADCKRVVSEFALDGIDIDWEYPGSKAGKISASPDDRDNFTLLMRDIRAAIGPDKLLTFADYADTLYVDYRRVMPYVDFLNLMTYDMDDPPFHQSSLYRSVRSGRLTVAEAVESHIKAGVDADRLVMGIPFFGRGKKYKGDRSYGGIMANDRYQQMWDSVAQVPYLFDDELGIVLSYDNQESVSLKCDYLLQKQLRGAMYWSADNDDTQLTLSRTIWHALKPED